MSAQEFAMLADKKMNDFLSNQFDTKDFLIEIENVLKGYRFDESQNKYIEIKDEAYLNSIGAKQVVNVIKGVIGNINSSSKLKLANIYEMREDIRFELLNLLGTNYKVYGLESFHLNSVLGFVDRAIWLFLSRTEEAGFFKQLSNFFKKQESQVITSREVGPPPKRGLSL